MTLKRKQSFTESTSKGGGDVFWCCYWYLFSVFNLHQVYSIFTRTLSYVKFSTVLWRLFAIQHAMQLAKFAIDFD